MIETYAFTSPGTAGEFVIKADDPLIVAVAGLFAGTVVLEQLKNNAWQQVERYTGITGQTYAKADILQTNDRHIRFRFRCLQLASGQVFCTIGLDLSLRPQMRIIDMTFIETPGAGVYQANHRLPEGAVVYDIIVCAVVPWSGVAVLDVGDDGNDKGYYAQMAINIAAPTADQAVSFSKVPPTVSGVYLGATSITRRFTIQSRIITARVTAQAGAAATGATRISLLYGSPLVDDTLRAVKTTGTTLSVSPDAVDDVAPLAEAKATKRSHHKKAEPDDDDDYPEARE